MALLQDRGYQNSILYIDLSTNKIWNETLDEKVMKLLLGGKGLGTYLLYKQLAPNTDPLSPDTPLIFVNGPLTGTIAPTSSRFGIVTKSPATGTYLDAYCGGFFGQMLKYAGYDALVIKGAATSPKVLVIDDGNVNIEDGSNVWGMTTFDATNALTDTYGKGFKTAVIGPTGERAVPIAGIFCDLRTLGRGGAGAVMGAKKLKGIAVRGTGAVQVHDQKEFEEMVWVAQRMLRMSSQIKRLSTDGTSNILELINATGALPTRNFQTGEFEESEKLDGEYWSKHYWVKSTACYGCPIACTKIAKSKTRDIAIDGPEYETMFAIGSNCGISDHEAIIYSNYLADLYGIDTISLGGIVAFTMELYQRHMISTDELGGIEAKFGSGDALIALTEIICKGEGIGNLLSKGVKTVAAEFEGSDVFAMHSKGLEFPGYLPRGAKGIGLSYAISERGACHLRGSPLTEVLGGADPLAIEGKAALFKSTQSETAVVDAAMMCYFVKFGFTLKEIWQMLNACTGFGYRNPRELEHVGERITTLARMFNVREGFDAKDDTLPKRCLSEPLPSGYSKGHVVELDEMRTEYYQMMGWDANGVPTDEQLKKLELDTLI